MNACCPLWLQWWLLVGCFICHLTESSSASTSSYTSVTALDKYGHSVQLRHAGQASSNYGSLVVAARCHRAQSFSKTDHPNDNHDDDDDDHDRAVVVASVRIPRQGVLVPTNRRGMVQAVYPGSNLYMICTGHKADATWLLQQMREYSRRVWERYDLTPSQMRLTNAMSEALLTFMGYDRSKEWHDGVGPVILDKEDQQQQQWSRPLGVQTFVVSSSSLTSNIVLVEPSGVQRTHLAYAIGRDSDLVNTRLRETYKPDLDTLQLQNILVDAVRTALLEESNDSSYDDNNVDIVVEVITSRGVDLKYLPLVDSSRKTKETNQSTFT